MAPELFLWATSLDLGCPCALVLGFLVCPSPPKCKRGPATLPVGSPLCCPRGGGTKIVPQGCVSVQAQQSPHAFSWHCMGMLQCEKVTHSLPSHEEETRCSRVSCGGVI